MAKFIDSFEAEKLKKLISSKKDYLTRLLDNDGNKAACQIMQREIMFLENDILPLIQNCTNLFHGEFSKYAVKCLESALEYKCNGLLLYQPIDENYCEQPIIGIANKRENQKFGTFGAMQVCIDNMDANGVKVKPINLLIDG